MASARQLVLDLLARDKTGPATKSAADNLDNVGESAAEAAKSTEKLGKESDRSDDKVERLGKSARTAAEHVEKLDHEIKTTERELKQLAVAFAEADTAAERLDLSKAIRRTQSDLKKLNGSKGLLEDLIPSKVPTGTGKGIATSLVKDIGEGLNAVKVPFAAGLAASLAPVAAGVLAGAVIGGAGIGGIIGGIALAAKDPAIAKQAKTLGANFKTAVTAEAKDAFAGPLKGSLDQLESFAARSVPRIGKIFDATAPSLQGFTKNVTHAGDAILNGLTKSAQRSGPVMSALGGVIAHTGDSIGDLISTIADHSDEAASSLKDLDKGIQGVVGTVTGALGVLLDLKGLLDDVERAAEKNKVLGAIFDNFKNQLMGPLPVIGELIGAIKGTKVASDAAIPAQKLLGEMVLTAGEAAGTAGQKMQTYADKMADAATKGQGLYASQTSVAQAIADTEKALKTNGKTLDINSQKGRDNRTALINLASALTANYDAYVKVNGEGAAAQAVAQHNRDEFIKLAIQMGKTRGQAEALATELGLIPAKKTTDFYANTHDAAARISALNKQANSAARDRTLNVHVSVTGAERLDSLGHRIGGYRAAGGPVRKGQAYVVGEHRPEVFVPNQSGTIIPSISRVGSGSSGGMGTMSAGESGGWVPIRGDAVIDALVQQIASRVSAKGGRAAQLGIRFT